MMLFILFDFAFIWLFWHSKLAYYAICTILNLHSLFHDRPFLSSPSVFLILCSRPPPLRISGHNFHATNTLELISFSYTKSINLIYPKNSLKFLDNGLQRPVSSHLELTQGKQTLNLVPHHKISLSFYYFIHSGHFTYAKLVT